MKNQRGGKIVLFVGHDLIGLMLANKFVPEFIKHGCIPILVNSRTHRNRIPRVPPPDMPSFYGAGIVDRILLPYLDSHPMQAVADGSVCRTYEQLRDDYNLDYIDDVADVNEPALVQRMEADPDLIGSLSLRSLQVLDPQTIKVFEDKGFCWNLHGGLLPDYKGLLIPYYAIDNGEENYGWTLHKMNSGLDTGDIIDKTVRPLNGLSSVFNVYAEMVPHAAVMVQEVLKNYLRTGRYPYAPQSPTATQGYYTYPTSAQMAAFNDKGIYFVDSPEAHVHFILSQFCADVNSREARGLQAALTQGVYEWRKSLSHAPKESLDSSTTGLADQAGQRLEQPKLAAAA